MNLSRTIMHFYLSSHKLGNSVEELKRLVAQGNKRAAYISNAMDVSSRVQKREDRENQDIRDLEKLGLSVERLDLKLFLKKKAELESKLKQFDVIWVCGGNTFVLRQAMHLSEFDQIFPDLIKRNIVYGGYSAGCCVLSKSLHGLDLMDSPSHRPYGENVEVVWEGLGAIEYTFVPHYKSDHPESTDADKVVKYCKENQIPFKAVRDGEVLVSSSYL